MKNAIYVFLNTNTKSDLIKEKEIILMDTILI